MKIVLYSFFIQLIGAIGFITLAYSYSKKEKKGILFMQIVSHVFLVLHYILLKGKSGAISNFIGMLAMITIYSYEKNRYKNYVVVFFMFLLLVVNIVFYQNIFSIFPMIASIIILISFLTSNENTIRLTGAIAALAWLIYAISVKSPIAIFYESLILFNAIRTFLLNKKQINKLSNVLRLSSKLQERTEDKN